VSKPCSMNQGQRGENGDVRASSQRLLHEASSPANAGDKAMAFKDLPGLVLLYGFCPFFRKSPRLH
jgi:hypothetical protein